MNTNAPREGVSPVALLRLPTSDSLQHTILFYDARVGVLNGLESELHRRFQIRWSAFETLLALDHAIGPDAENAVPVKWVRKEASTSDSSFHRRILELSGPGGWVERVFPKSTTASGHGHLQWSERGREARHRLMAFLGTTAAS